MVYDYLSNTNMFEMGATYYDLKDKHPTTNSKNRFFFDASKEVPKQLDRIFSTFSPDYLVNCIGVIKPYCKDDNGNGVRHAIAVNALFPHLLSQHTAAVLPSARIIQIATDCVFDGIKGNYSEHDLHNATDVYGKTKSLGEVRNFNFLNIRCSIIGPEINNKSSLMEWFLSNPDGSTVNGFADHTWNGITTLQFAELCESLTIDKHFDELRALGHTLHFTPNATTTKYSLLKMLNQSFKRTISITKVENNASAIDRSLCTVLWPVPTLAMETAVERLAQYCRNGETFTTSTSGDQT